MPTLATLTQGGSTKEIVKRVKIAPFGEGYKQIQVDGINPILETWRVSFIQMVKADAIALENNLKAWLWDTPIDWQAPSSNSLTKWRVIGVSARDEEGLVFEVSATLETYYGV